MGKKPLHRGNQLLRLRQQLKAALPVPGLKQAQLTHGPLRGGPHPEHHLIVKPIPVRSQNPAGHPSKPPGPERNAAKLRNIPRQRNRKRRSVQQPEPVQAAHHHALAILLKRPGKPRLLLPVGKNIHKRRLQRPGLQFLPHPFQARQGLLRPGVVPARQLAHALAQISKRLLPAHVPGAHSKPLIPLNHMLHLVQNRIQHHAGSRVLPAPRHIHGNIMLLRIGKPSRAAPAVPVKIHPQLPQLRVSPEQLREIQGRGQGNIHMPPLAHADVLLPQPHPAGINNRLPLPVRRICVGKSVIVVLLEGRCLLPDNGKRRRRILIIRPRSPGGLVRKRRNLNIVPVKNHVIIRLLFLHFPAGIAVCVPDAFNIAGQQRHAGGLLRLLFRAIFSIPKSIKQLLINIFAAHVFAAVIRPSFGTFQSIPHLFHRGILQQGKNRLVHVIPAHQLGILYIQLHAVIGRHARPHLYLVQMVKQRKHEAFQLFQLLPLLGVRLRVFPVSINFIMQLHDDV